MESDDDKRRIMKRSTNNLDVKKLNRNRAFCYINSVQQTSMPEIATKIGVSVPTVLSIVNELKETGIVKEVGELSSTGGRKAKAVAVEKGFCYSIGVDITQNHVGITYTDLSLKALKYKRIRKVFHFTDEYLDALLQMIEESVREWEIPEEKIIGMGISMPAIVDEEKEIITDSHALGLRKIPCERITRYMPYPCHVMNDANAAATAENSVQETSIRENSGNIVYLSLSNTVGGALLFQTGEGGTEKDSFHGSSRMYKGDHWRSGEFGHMVIHPNGKTCYCGKKGCLDAYCSALVLANETNGNLESFFEQMEAGNKKFASIWDEYLSNLAIAVDNLRMSLDCQVVLGGYVGNHMQSYMKRVQRMVAEKDIFDRNGNFVHACNAQMESSALGVAIRQIEKYIDTI